LTTASDTRWLHLPNHAEDVLDIPLASPMTDLNPRDALADGPSDVINVRRFKLGAEQALERSVCLCCGNALFAVSVDVAPLVQSFFLVACEHVVSFPGFRTSA
jgi:hypothetical protein